MTLKSIDEKNNAVFTIRNNQTFDDKTDVVEIVTEGSYKARDGMYFLIYKEYTELGEISVLVKVLGETVSIRRTGACSSRMEYESGTRREILYHVPYGDLVMDLETENVKVSLNDDGGSINMKYKLTIGEESYLNNMTLEVRLNEKG